VPVASRSVRAGDGAGGRAEWLAFAAVCMLTMGMPSLAGAADYATTTSTGIAIAPGTTDIGNHCDECPTPITLPFAVSVYGASFTSAVVDVNGYA